MKKRKRKHWPSSNAKTIFQPETRKEGHHPKSLPMLGSKQPTAEKLKRWRGRLGEVIEPPTCKFRMEMAAARKQETSRFLETFASCGSECRWSEAKWKKKKPLSEFAYWTFVGLKASFFLFGERSRGKFPHCVVFNVAELAFAAFGSRTRLICISRTFANLISNMLLRIDSSTNEMKLCVTRKISSNTVIIEIINYVVIF